MVSQEHLVTAELEERQPAPCRKRLTACASETSRMRSAFRNEMSEQLDRLMDIVRQLENNPD